MLLISFTYVRQDNPQKDLEAGVFFKLWALKPRVWGYSVMKLSIRPYLSEDWRRSLSCLVLMVSFQMEVCCALLVLWWTAD